MREIVIGIVIRGQNAAAPALDKTAEGARKVGTEVEKAAKKSDSARSSFRTLGMAAVGLNQAFELAKKAAELYERTVGRWIAASLESRASSDSSRRSLEQLAQAGQRLSVALGDVLVPVLAGIATALRPVIESATAWLRVNRELASAKVVEWGTALANVLVSGVAQGTLAVARAWSGWGMIVDSVKLAVNASLAATLAGMMSLVRAWGELQERFKDSEAVHAAARLYVELKRLRAEFVASGQDAEKALYADAAALDSIETKIRQVEQLLRSGIGTVATKAMAQVGAAVQRAGVDWTAYEARLKNAMAAERAAEERTKVRLGLQKQLAAEMDRAARQVVRSGEMEAAAYQRANADLALLDQRAQAAAESVGGTVAGGLITLFKAAAQGGQQLGQAVEGFFLGLLESIGTMVLQLLVKLALLKAFEFFFAGPLAGLGTLFGFANGGVVPGYSAGGVVQSFAPGGFVSGGPPGRDSVPAMLMPGELVLPVPVAKWLAGALKTPSPSPSGGGAQAGARATNVNIGQWFPSDRATVRRFVRDAVLPELRALERDRG